MTCIPRAQALLSKCEAELRSLVATAASEGDYDAVLKLTSWARAIAGLSAGGVNPGTQPAPASAPGKKAKRTTAYPRFERRGDSLVKVGWSKREKAEYEHKAPISAIDALALAVPKAGADGRIFPVSALLPCHGPGESYVPDYQVYLIIAWWRNIGLLEQHGRQGYSIIEPGSFAMAVEHACNDLTAI